MATVIDGRPGFSVNLDSVGKRRPRLSPAGITSIVLLCLAIVIVVGWLIKLGVTNRRGEVIVQQSEVEFDEQEVSPAPTAVSAVSLIPEPILAAPQAVAVGAAVVETDPGNELPYLHDAVGATAAPQAPANDSNLAKVAFFGDLVPENERMEAPDASASLSLGSVMPAGWRGGAEGASLESESHPLHDYFTPFGSLTDDGLGKENPRWAELRLSREATKRAIENTPDVTRAGYQSRPKTYWVDETAALRPATKAPLFTSGVHVFQDSQQRQEVVALAMQGVYPQESLGFA